MSTASKQRLMAEYKTLDKEKWLNIEVGSYFRDMKSYRTDSAS
jgi:hypothetical protein